MVHAAQAPPPPQARTLPLGREDPSRLDGPAASYDSGDALTPEKNPPPFLQLFKKKRERKIKAGGDKETTI